MLTLKSPAKLNLFLKVLGRRPDGYHDIASLFQAISLCDTLHFALSGEDQLECSEPSLPAGKSNLIWKAADLFRQKTGLQFNLHVVLEKNIPTEAGLGGGSSNAATTLLAINQLLGYSATHAQLLEWAAEIGSDVTFFLSSGTAYCTGRGEIIRPMPPLPKQTVTLFKPNFGLSTPAVYKNLKVESLNKVDPEVVLRKFIEGRPEYFNDLEGSAFDLMPGLANLKKGLMDRGYSTVLMSGSGTTFFCLGNGKPLDFQGLQSFKAEFIDRPSFL